MTKPGDMDGEYVKAVDINSAGVSVGRAVDNKNTVSFTGNLVRVLSIDSARAPCTSTHAARASFHNIVFPYVGPTLVAKNITNEES